MDFSTSNMPPNAIGIVARVVTFADDLDAFHQKVAGLVGEMDGELIFIEETFMVSDFLIHRATKDSEIFELLETAKKFPNDVVYGKFQYYTQDDS